MCWQVLTEGYLVVAVGFAGQIVLCLATLPIAGLD